MPVDHSPTRGDARIPEEASGGYDTPQAQENLAQTSAERDIRRTLERSQVNIGEERESNIHAAKLVKLPPFWKENPVLWFTQCEAAFALSRITSDETRFRYVIVNLDTAVLPFVSDIIGTPPIAGKYQTLKERIINTFDDTAESKLRRLLRGNELRDEKPSSFLQRLRNLAGGQCSDTVLRTLFLEQLPDHVRSILAISEVADVTRLAVQADKIIEVTRTTVAPVTMENPDKAEKEPDLKAVIEALTQEISKLRAHQRRDSSRSRSRNRQSTIPRFIRQHPKKENSEYCYYHATYGEKARRCKPPCKWPGAKEN